MRHIRALLLLVLLAAPLRAEGIDLSRPLPVDPSVIMGELPNGLRYQIRPNRTPPGKVSLLLHIGSGSLNEEEDQRGLAHFLEHMAFNGSENFPPGRMVKFFESLGMRFGQHQNAFTSFDQTTYMMHLPDSKPETLEKVLLYFADVGWRLSMLPAEIGKERGVILAEARARKGAQQRIMEQAMPFMIPGSRLADRIPIGLESVIKEAGQDRFLAYYRKWYRPENSVLIVCGDIEVETLVPMIGKAFGGWKRAEKPAERYEPGIKPHTDLRVAVLTDPELTRCSIGISSIDRLRGSGTIGDFRRGLLDDLATWIVNRRLRQLVQKGEAPFHGSSVSSQPMFNAAHASGIDTNGDPAKWREMLAVSLSQVKRARVHGFSEAELERAKTSLISSAEQDARAEPTISSTALIMGLNRAATIGRKPISRAQRLELTRVLLEGITAEDVAEAFSDSFPLDRGVIMATMPQTEGVAVPTEPDLRAVAKKALAADVERMTEEKQAARLLEKDPGPAAVTARVEDAGFGISTTTFANGARVHCRSMDFRKDRVLVVVRLVGGRMDETEESAQLTGVGALALSPRSAASKRLSSSQISDILTGRKIGFGGAPAGGGLSFRVSGSPEDLEEGFRLLHLLLTEPRIEQAAFDRWRTRMELRLANLDRNLGAQAGNAVTALLSGNDVRLATPTLERVHAIEREAAQAWIEKVLRTAPIEVAVVGDMPRDRMEQLAARYIGTMPKRAVAREDLDGVLRVKQDKGPLTRTVTVESITRRAEVRMGWRGAPRSEREDRRVLQFASQVLSTRLLDEIREKRGLTYSIGCRAVPGSFDGMGRLSVVFTADPDKAAGAASIARSIVEDFLEKSPPTDAEMASVKRQIANSFSTQLQQPRFWGQVLSSMLTDGRTLDEISRIERNFASITKEQIASTLARYVTKERFYQVIAVPE